MRSVSLVNRLELEFPGTLFQNGMCFGDVDNDQANELVACNTSGDLAIYRGKSTKPWRRCSGLGFATFVGIDDVQNRGQNSIIVINAEGMCYIFDCLKTAAAPSTGNSVNMKASDDKLNRPPQEKGKPKSPHQTPLSTHIAPAFKQQLPPNCRTAIIFDTDKDGKKELVAAYTDRTVRIFRWESSGSGKSKGDHMLSSKKEKKSRLVKQASKDEDRKPQGPIKQSSKDSNKDLNASGTDSDGAESTTTDGDAFASLQEGKFILLKKIGILAQIGSLAVCSLGEGCHHLLASQPGGGYIVLDSYGINGSEKADEKVKLTHTTKPLDGYPVRSLLSGVRSRPLVGNTEIIGLVQRQGRLSGVMGFCTLDGVFGVMDFLSGSPAVHSMTTEHKWFAMDKLDVTMDGNDEIVYCAWDGMTYVLNRDQDILCYNFGENVCAFKAGMYSLQTKSNVPCLCYATFSNRIMLYYDIAVDSMEGKSLYNEILERLAADEKYESVLRNLKDGDGKVNIEKLKDLIRI